MFLCRIKNLKIHVPTLWQLNLLRKLLWYDWKLQNGISTNLNSYRPFEMLVSLLTKRRLNKRWCFNKTKQYTLSSCGLLTVLRFTTCDCSQVILCAGDAGGGCGVWASRHGQRGHLVPALYIRQHREAQRISPHSGWIPAVCCTHTPGKYQTRQVTEEPHREVSCKIERSRYTLSMMTLWA